MRFVKLTNTTGESVFIDLEHVVRITQHGDKSWVFMMDQTSLLVKESAEQILIKLPVIGG